MLPIESLWYVAILVSIELKLQRVFEEIILISCYVFVVAKKHHVNCRNAMVTTENQQHIKLLNYQTIQLTIKL